MSDTSVYQPVRAGRSLFVPVRGLRYHVTMWGDPSLITPERPALVMGHGYMDVGASFQFLVDALARLEGEVRCVIAPDWRGFGLTRPDGADSYWFADYLGDLDGLLASPELGLQPDQPIDLLGHSMGGNIVMSYAGVRDQRIRRLINLEGFGLPATKPTQGPGRLAQWLNELQTPQVLRDYASLDEVAQRLRKTNPRLPADRAAWLARHWSEQGSNGRWQILGDPAHKRPSALLYQVEEVLETWRRISAPVLWVDGDETNLVQWWGDRYPRSEFDARLSVVRQVERHTLLPCGHMLHHDQPDALAALLHRFLA